MVTAREALREGSNRLRAAGIENPRLEARLLLAQAIGSAPEAVIANPDRLVATHAYCGLIGRRAEHEPLALILGRREFWSLDFAVSGATLIPRPDSETLIEAALALFPARDKVCRTLDLGTGTGCLLLALLTEFPRAFGIGIDWSEAAVRLARQNARSLGLAQRASFAVTDWASAVCGRFDLVLCNPPYVATGDLPGLMTEVRSYEPRLALDGGPDGLAAYRAIFPVLPRLLTPGGAAVFEVGLGEALRAEALAKAAGLTTSLCADLGGISRALVLRIALP
jgi:release factor glutamine methyltransferase